MRLQKLIVLLIALSMSAFLLAGCQSDDDSSSSSSGFSVSPGSSSIAMGASTQLTATSNGSDVTTSTTWSSSDSSIVAVSDSSSSTTYPKGTITAKRTGTATITATYNGQTANASITVTSATLSSIQVSPQYQSLSLAATPEVKYTAIGIYSDGTKLDLSEYVTWSSSNTSVATISNTANSGGLSTTVAAGTTTISAVFEASSGNKTGTTDLTLTSATISSVEVTPIQQRISTDDNSTIQMAANVLLSDGSIQDVTNQVYWSSSSTNAPVSNASNSMGLVTGIGAIAPANIDASLSGTAASAGTNNSSNVTVDSTTNLGELQIFPPAPSIAVGLDYQLAVKGVYNDGTNYYTQDLTKTAVWSSSNQTVATVCNSSSCKGKISALSSGTATITASMPGPITHSITLTVNSDGLSLASIQVTPTDPSVYSGTKQQFIATGIYTDGTTYFHEDITDKVIWSSSDSTVAVISNGSGTEGQVKNRAAGTTTITATKGSVSGTSTLTVLSTTLSSVEVSPANPTLIEGMKQQFKAIGVFTVGTTTVLKDITNDVIWSSGTVGTGRISNATGSKGELVSIANGTTTVTADLGGTTGTSSVTVLDTAGGTYNYSDFQITPEINNIPISVGTVKQLTATIIFVKAALANDYERMDLTKVATWVSSNTAVATVDNFNGTSGLVRGHSAGSATITARWKDGAGTTRSATKDITVNAYTINSLQISPSNQSLDLGMEQQYQGLGIYSDGTNYLINDLPPELVWLSTDSSSSSTINAPIGSDDEHAGLATAISAGTSTIYARLGSSSATETLTTTDLTLQSITISPASPTIGTETKLQFKAFGSYSDGVNREITDLVRWTSGTPATALIKNSDIDKGLVKALAAGTTTITAALGSSSSDTTLTVKANTTTATGIQVTPSAPVLGAGTTLQLSATGILTAGTTSSQDLTGQVYWVSGTPTVATVSNDDETNGRVYGVAAGTSTLTAYWTGTAGTQVAVGSATVTVTSGSLSSIEISPDQPDGPVGYTEQLTATALYSDNNTQDITESVIWTSSDTSVVTVSNEEGSRGQITRKAYGTATITARFGTTTDTASVSVW